jgi:hypothetical protein
MPFNPQDPDRICKILLDFNQRSRISDLLANNESNYGEPFVETVQGLLDDIETLKLLIAQKENQFAENSVDFNMGSSQLAPGVVVGNLKKVGSIEYFEGKGALVSYRATLAQMQSTLDSRIKSLTQVLNLALPNCTRTILR